MMRNLTAHLYAYMGIVEGLFSVKTHPLLPPICPALRVDCDGRDPCIQEERMLRDPHLLRPLAASLCLILASLAQAQTPPTGEELLREAEKASSRTRRPDLPPPPQPTPSKPASTAVIVVQRFNVQGARLIDSTTIQAILKPWVGQKSDLASLQRAADAIVEAYRRSGYLARAWLPEQEIRDGVVLIRVAEGRLSGLRIENRGAPRALPEPRVREFMLARQREGEVLRIDDIQRAVTLLNEMPGMHAA